MSRRILICGAALWLALSTVLSCFGNPLFRDDFQTPRGRYEFHGGRAWTMKDGQCRFATPQNEHFVVVNLDQRDQMRIEASLRIDRRIGPGYVMAGPSLFLDPDNHWRLMLVAGPEDKPYFELVERCQGQHQAQNAPGARLAGKREGTLQTWQYGQTYRLILAVTPQGITGEVQDPSGKKFWRQSYTFATPRVVRQGRPALTAAGLEGAFQQFSVDGPMAASAAQLPIASGQAGSVAIVDDESKQLAAALEPLFAQAGYGVTRVKWDDLRPGRLSATSLDLLVLADARRLPTTVAATVVNYLRSGGKVLAVGAPAFGQLLLKTPQGYVTRDEYAGALYQSLTRRPLKTSPAGWKRGASDSKRPTKLTPEGQGWKAAMDLDAWDFFGHAVPDAFADRHQLLCFRARGDAQTPQLFVECTEKDRSRWIATVELSTDWRPFVLRPTDFTYWPDSTARRGGAGDHFVPANVASIQIGLSHSHTPLCKSGPHTFWVEDLATATDPNPEEPDFHVPDIEGFSPSHKLYPLHGPISLQIWSGSGCGNPPCLGPLSEGSSNDLVMLLPRTNGAVTAYAPNPRETGIGFARHRACRWVRMMDAFDSTGRNRGSAVWLMLGEDLLPGAIWASIGMADPAALVAKGPTSQVLQPVLLKLAKAMTRGCFFLEAGSRYFSYHPGETIDFGVLAMNAGRRKQSLTVSYRVTTTGGKVVFEQSSPLDVAAGERQETSCTWTPPAASASQFPYTVTVQLRADGQVLDCLSHHIDNLSSHKAGPDQFVRVEGSQFKLGGKPWYMLGINYWPNSQGGRPTVPYLQREYYNPELIEQDLIWMQAAGINMLSGIQAPVFPESDGPGAYRDLQDFVERCHRHGMKLFYFLRWGNPMNGADPEAIKRHIDAAGLKNHPAILAWELAWEPIYYGATANGKMDSLLGDWNAWIVDRYGSLDEAERDWGYQLPRTAAKDGATKALAALPDHQWCAKHGPWDRMIAAFRQFFSDRVGQGYGDLIRDLRRYDPNHLITFRFGACGIPEGFRFAHSHSASVAKHVDFLCPEGYNLQPGGPSKLTPADDLRKGGLVTLYYRFLSREKPVVWMEFGYTVNGMRKQWKTGDVEIPASELANQRTEFENFYQMFLESGARGAAPWWLPGGFRLGECSDFGILEPDGTERPACQVLKQSLPKFAQIRPTSCVAPTASKSAITLDLDAHYPDSWSLYGGQYLEAVKAGRVPTLRTDGTGTTSADCPLVAVGNTPLNGHNPPKYLNAEFSTVEVKVGNAPWREVARGKDLSIRPGEVLLCRASVGNIAEATWEATGKPGRPGIVYLTCRIEPSDKSLDLPLAAATPYLADGVIREFLLPTAPGQQTVTLQMCVVRTKPDGTKLTIPFGEKRAFVVKTQP
jgi:hypothetical protein